MPTILEHHEWAQNELPISGVDPFKAALVDGAAHAGDVDKFFETLADAYAENDDAVRMIEERRHTMGSTTYSKMMRTRKLPMAINRKVNAKRRRVDYAKNAGGIKRKQRIYSRRWNARFGEAYESVDFPPAFGPSVEELLGTIGVDYVASDDVGVVTIDMPESIAEVLFDFFEARRRLTCWSKRPRSADVPRRGAESPQGVRSSRARRASAWSAPW